MRSLSGQTALVAGGGGTVGRAIALALAARGVRIVVTGRDEKALGVTVGEVVHAGAKARHVAGDPADPAVLAAAFDRAAEVFGPVSIVVAGDEVGALCMLSEAKKRMEGPGRVIVVAGFTAAAVGDTFVSSVLETGHELVARGITTNAIVTDESFEDAPENAAELVVFLCSRAGASLSNQIVAVGHAVRKPPPA